MAAQQRALVSHWLAYAFICFKTIAIEYYVKSPLKDIDECDRFNPCDQNCTNTVGSFMCSCQTGYELHDDTTTCTGEFMFNIRHLHIRCVCNILLTDIDECQVAALNNSVICTNDTQCTNAPGSFECGCVPGYRLVDGNCERKHTKNYKALFVCSVILHIQYVIGFVEMAPEIQIAVPSMGENNIHNFVVLTFERTEVTLLHG